MNAETRAANERARVLKIIRQTHRHSADRRSRVEQLTARFEDAEKRNRRQVPLHHHADDAF